jgi:predicted transposase/invertase (TIGR01784 family)
MYDNTCKFLAENFSTDFASWLLGEPITLTKLEQSELALDPIRADSVILLQSQRIIMHLEFQTRTDQTMAFRMLDYWVRLRRKYPQTKIYQVVIYLKPTNSPLVYQTSFESEQATHKFNVIRLWEQPTEIFQQYAGLLPLAVLTKTENATEVLKQVVKQMDDITDQKVKNNLAATTAIISGLVLDKEVIQRLLRSDIMKESVIYQEILLEGEAKGEARGEAKAANQIAINMLRSGLAVDLIAQLTGLSLEQIQRLQY